MAARTLKVVRAGNVLLETSLNEDEYVELAETYRKLNLEAGPEYLKVEGPGKAKDKIPTVSDFVVTITNDAEVEAKVAEAEANAQAIAEAADLAEAAEAEEKAAAKAPKA